MDKEVLTLECVRQYVWSGFYDPDEIVELIDEAVFQPGQIDHSWLRVHIEQEFRKKKVEEATWNSVTDCDRLDRAFNALKVQGILALHNAGYTQSDGLSDVTQFYHEAGGQQSNIVGYCFYHGQDVECVMEVGELWLTYGDILGNDDKGAEIGRRIKSVLEREGFTVEWDGSINTR